MADRCQFCMVRLDGYEVHADTCPVMGETIRAEIDQLRDDNDWLAGEVERLREALGEALDLADRYYDQIKAVRPPISPRLEKLRALTKAG